MSGFFCDLGVCQVSSRLSSRPLRRLRGGVLLRCLEEAPGGATTLEEVTFVSPGELAQLAKRSLVFGAFSQPLPGTRPVELQGRLFYAFCSPREGTDQVLLWRRLGDVVDAGYGLPSPQVPVRVQRPAPGLSLSPGRLGFTKAPWSDLYRMQAYSRNAWTFWESFWVPIGEAAAVCLGSSARALAAMRPSWSSEALQLCSREAPRGPEPSQAVPTPPAILQESKADAFSQIYRQKVWPGLLSRSGPGSDPFHPMVRIALTALHMVVEALNIRSMLDAACGDAGWMAAHFLPMRPEVTYYGADIVSHVIEENRQRHPSLTFLVADLSEGGSKVPLPKVDLVFSKETLNHMFVQDAAHALQRLQTTGARYLLANITRGSPNELGASKGRHANYAQYDYSLPPFHLRKLKSLVECNQEDWTEFALFDLQGR